MYLVMPKDISSMHRSAFRYTHKAFTLIEVILVVLILGIMAGFVIPSLDFGVLGKLKADTHASMFSNTLRVARSMAIMHASTNGAGYKVKLSPASPYTSYQILNALDASVVKGVVALPSGLSCTGVSEITFNGLGDAIAGSSQVVQFSESGTCYQVTVWPVGGRIEVEVCP